MVINKHLRYVHFDWAIKRLLRNKSDFVILEGFLSAVLNEKFHIESILESESNQDRFDDKFNRVDMLVKNDKGELVIVEVQNNHELDYFHRMLYGASKAIAEYINLGQPYDFVRKVYSINIVYFELGQGSDYAYHGKTTFIGINNGEKLQLSDSQRKRFIYQEAGDVFPEYFVLRVNDFDKHAVTPLDQWIEFLKTGIIDENATAAGLPQAREKLRIDTLPAEEKRAYIAHLEALGYQKSVIETNLILGRAEGRKEGIEEGIEVGIKKGEEKKQLEIARKMMEKGMPWEEIEEITGVSKEELEK